jgi:hypothetical protein
MSRRSALIILATFCLAICLIFAGHHHWRASQRDLTATNLTRCRAHLEAIWRAIDQYARENSGRLPDNLDDLIKSKALTKPSWANEVTQITSCPSNADGSTYIYLGRGHTTGESPNMIIMSESWSNHTGFRNVLYLDGRIETESERTNGRGRR